MNDPHYVLVHGVVTTPFGQGVRIHIERMDGAPMPWREVYDVFEHTYPGRWAIQAFPPKAQLMDRANKYHLLVFDTDFPAWAGL